MSAMEDISSAKLTRLVKAFALIEPLGIGWDEFVTFANRNTEHPVPALSARPDTVDILIAAYNASDFLEKCVDALKRNTYYPHRVFIADDNSRQPQMARLLEKLDQDPQIRVLRYSRRVGFPGNNNRAIKQTTADAVCLLNQDTEPQANWLTRMVARMETDAKIGIVGAKLLYPQGKAELAGTIQHVGVARYPDSAPYHIYAHQKADHPAANIVRDVNAVTGACMLVRSECWKQLNGFDEAYRTGQFEDIDFCWRAREIGWRIVVEPKAVLFHYEHGCGEQYVLESHDANRELLLKRWGHLGSDEHIFK